MARLSSSSSSAFDFGCYHIDKEVASGKLSVNDDTDHLNSRSAESCDANVNSLRDSKLIAIEAEIPKIVDEILSFQEVVGKRGKLREKWEAAFLSAAKRVLHQAESLNRKESATGSGDRVLWDDVHTLSANDFKNATDKSIWCDNSDSTYTFIRPSTDHGLSSSHTSDLISPAHISWDDLGISATASNEANGSISGSWGDIGLTSESKCRAFMEKNDTSQLSTDNAANTIFHSWNNLASSSKTSSIEFNHSEEKSDVSNNLSSDSSSLNDSPSNIYQADRPDAWDTSPTANQSKFMSQSSGVGSFASTTMVRHTLDTNSMATTIEIDHSLSPKSEQETRPISNVTQTPPSIAFSNTLNKLCGQECEHVASIESLPTQHERNSSFSHFHESFGETNGAVQSCGQTESNLPALLLLRLLTSSDWDTLHRHINGYTQARATIISDAENKVDTPFPTQFPEDDSCKSNTSNASDEKIESEIVFFKDFASSPSVDSIAYLLRKSRKDGDVFSVNDFNSILARISISPELLPDEIIDLLLQVHMRMTELSDVGFKSCHPDATTYEILLLSLTNRTPASINAMKLVKQYMLSDPTAWTPHTVKAAMLLFEKRDCAAMATKLFEKLQLKSAQYNSIPNRAYHSLIYLMQLEDNSARALEILRFALRVSNDTHVLS